MKIKRIEIIGFKSFVDRTVLEFPPGVTAVVGPNGCGKSNVVDAIRWVMGEQSAKNLRGRQMEDIIFAGSETRKPLGMAEVSLVFSTDDGRVPAKYLNYSEIQVTRRLYRDGDSEYSLNKTPCRLLDINELFMDTGVGARAYSIIEQGRIGMILMAKPEERRFLIEEAAGVTKFKARKQVALKKIDNTRQNLLRIGDVVAEIRRQLGSLQRQAKKAERFRTLREELKGIEIAFATRRYRQLADESRHLELDLAERGVRVTSLAAEAASADNALEERRIALLEEEKALAAAQEEIFRAKGEYQSCENRLEFQRKELANLERQGSRFDEELTGLVRQQGEAEAELRHLERRKGELLVEAAQEQEGLQSQNSVLEALRGEEAALLRRQEEERQQTISLLNRVAQLNNQQSEAGRRLARLAERFERSEREGAELSGRLFAAGARVEELAAAFQKATAAKAGLAEAVGVLVARGTDLRNRLAAAEQSLQAGRDELSAKGSRLVSLKELDAQFAGYGQGVRTLFGAEPFSGRFAGLVADLLETGEAYEAALEGVLGERQQYVLCLRDEDALAAVAHLKETAGGRCSFLLPGWGDAAAVAALPEMPRLLDLVRITPDRRQLVEPLLADVYLADGLEAALAASRRHPRLTFVTREGEVATGGGVVTGGSAEGTGQGLIHTKREIRELTATVAVLEETVAARGDERTRLRGELAAAEDELKRVRQELHQSEMQLVHLEKDLQRGREEVQRLEDRRSVKGMEDDQLVEEKSALEQERAAAAEALAVLEGEKAAREQDAAGLQADLKARRAEIDAHHEKLTGLKVRVATLEEKREANQRGIKRVSGLIDDLARRIASLRQELVKGQEERERLQQEVASGDKALAALVQQHVAAEAAHAAVRVRFEEQTSLLQEQEATLKVLREQLAAERDRVGQQNLRQTELTLQLRHLEGSMQERYRLDIAALPDDEPLADLDEPAMRQRQEELQKLVAELGEVNLMAIDEYKELEERYTFLSSQKADLEDSLQELQKAIQRINRTTRKRFLETFHLVNEQFREVFPRLFCGGRAELRLTNEEDLLETGIEIIVQPPGKKLQNVSLLSGGEKALTAVALIFSIFLVKPSPFCLLDEVDAPLDDANIGRFNDMIREMTAFSQFILITHSKTTMAVADTLYGVTMEDPGVSKVVSVRLQ